MLNRSPPDVRSTHVLLGFVERDEDTLYNSAMLVSATGELVALARKTALTDTDAQWASYGRGAKSMPVVDLPPIHPRRGAPPPELIPTGPAVVNKIDSPAPQN